MTSVPVNESEGDGFQLPSPSKLHIWDSRYGRPAEAFSIFRETICNTFMPWTPELTGTPFEGRVESISLERGVVGRVRMTPIIAVKTKQNIANSIHECIHGNFILSGELEVVQDARTNIARPGDLVLYRSFSPVTLTVKPDEFFDNLAFTIPRSELSNISNADDKLYNCLLPKNNIILPLVNCLKLLTGTLHSSSQDELSAILNACIALLPLAAGCLSSAPKKIEESLNHVLCDVLNFINKNISNPDLSPRLTAQELGVSTRYIHKLFAHSGTTFSAHIMGERLDHIKSELIAMARVPVSLLAFQWGFNDLSTFNRAFKDRFNCTPSDVRAANFVVAYGNRPKSLGDKTLLRSSR